MKSKNIRLAFYVTGSALRLLKLLKRNSVVIKDTVLVVNDDIPDVRLNALLSKNDIPYIEVNYRDLGLISDQKNIFISNLLLEKFNEYDIDYCFCFGGRILKGNLLRVYKNRIINFHPSILPSFPGIKSIDQALHKTSFLLGNTAHFIDEGIDTGPVIMQSILHRKKYATYESILGLQIPMIEQIYRWIIDNRLITINNSVDIKGADYTQTIFYPKLEVK
ncbi:MAG: Phosphoribosylglycinamide formyltransferase [Microgenomates group bacterium GW2011_GWC1_43_11]|uniref:Phosphoribosylglycinamide formyltransferase n=2 Tax=Candidatus Gottesmaniibacteriota TaxID=1752720 RepID=A0A0G1KZ84_9BACT|nr:MAG: Phosphoribosylglycinamide formyltransferase [Microgenomates group bacterium GW2011_GWC1_43_11]KKT39169.1 MAG: Phosphoribosylglycinamide formyltransferase [Candidatus Gottesmanbacteria bacterium GW2011_GWB1_44_11c]KKT61642.1 MAG: Phosphoribosylglycinamide formyltransferase [Candidatus Gottesmanbacteria bacterium GW2011_GWA1_44_24b]HCM82161.1 hypothetical protein [Patescibacteria group bacterium]